MKIAVCIKQVPEEIQINKKTGTLVRDGIKGMINPCDKNAIELAVTLKEKYGCKVTLISMGPDDVENNLMHGLAMGADEAVLLCDKLFSGADTFATALVLAAAIKKLKDYQLVICGKETTDSGTRQVGPQVASFLGMDYITSVIDIAMDGPKITVKKELRDEIETLETNSNILITVAKGTNDPRMPTYLDIYEASEKNSYKWCHTDLGLIEDQIGMKGSPTRIVDVFSPEAKRECRFFKGTPSEVCDSLVQVLKSRELI